MSRFYTTVIEPLTGSQLGASQVHDTYEEASRSVVGRAAAMVQPSRFQTRILLDLASLDPSNRDELQALLQTCAPLRVVFELGRQYQQAKEEL